MHLTEETFDRAAVCTLMNTKRQWTMERESITPAIPATVTTTTCRLARMKENQTLRLKTEFRTERNGTKFVDPIRGLLSSHDSLVKVLLKLIKGGGNDPEKATLFSFIMGS